MEYPDNQRFSGLLEWLKHSGKIVNDADFAKKLGVGKSYVSEIKNNKRTLTPTFVEQIYNTFPIFSRAWLLSGAGKMLDANPNSEAIPTLPVGWLNVPVVPATAQAGYLSGYGDPVYIEALDTMPFPVDKHYKGRYMCFEVRGDSMDDGSSDAIISGDFVLGREIPQHLWHDYKLHYRRYRAFVIVTREEGVIIKQITGHDVDNHTVTLHSLNPLFTDYEVDLSEVLEIYNVVQVTRRI